MEIIKHSTLPDETKTIRKKMSRADVKLKEIEQQLQNAQEQFNYIKKRLAHMKNVCEERGFINSKGFINSSANSSNCVISSIQESNCSSTNEFKISHNTLSNGKNDHEEIRKIYSYTSTANSIKSIVVNNGADLDIFENEFQTEEYVSKDQKPSSLKIAMKVFSDKRLNNSDEQMSISTDELSSNSHNLDQLNDLKLLEIFKPFPPTSKSDKKSQLILKINGTHKETSKQCKIKKFDKMKKNLSHENLIVNEQPQLNKVREHNRSMIIRKVRKLKKASIDHLESKHALSNLVTKSRKKFKRRALMNRKGKNSHLKSNIKNLETIKIFNKYDPTPDVVELYHNTATKNTTPSVESSKHYIELQNETNHEDLGQNQNSMKFIQNEVNTNLMNLNFFNSPKEKFHQLDLKGQFSEVGIQDSFSRKKERPDEPRAEDHHHHRHENCHSRSLRSYCCELIPTARNYQQPTIASKLKKVEKCYLATKFDFGNIPFVVGTSITPSHNIGLNIQQVLSSLKTKQHQITADFQYEPINKSGKTFNSIIQSLLETLNANSIIQSKSLVYSNAIKEEDNATTTVEQSKKPVENKQKKQSIIHNTKNLSEDIRITKNKNSLSNYQNFSSSGTFENTMRKIHDRFNILNEKYEYLQNQLLKTNDKKIKKKLTQVENELNEKEEEINAIVGLCFEVAALKRQLKMQHNSSLLYITTKCSTHNSTKINSSTTARPQNTHSLHITEYQQRKTPISKKMPPTTKVFAGLLRNIQSIQHQLTTI
ncbi:uncharacterized protein [Chelonus insularis]|uniref:uncharacterized protein isoform X2 n=1 Tax=Chelonus insularis TaxID=460826 RepID=UPI00158BE832|nr:uncharacterized protein LOC118065023 isoform X2 [Chelonus insularis]